jgi:hypothetical protein
MRTRTSIILVIVLSGTFLFSFVQVPVKKLIGNWVSTKDISFGAPGDTLRFEKKKYSYELYTWGKFPSGIEFKEDSSFAEYHNINCSEESDEVFYHDERFHFVSDSVIEVKGYARSFRWKVISVSSKKLSLKILP